jgi:hypothetical protein
MSPLGRQTIAPGASPGRQTKDPSPGTGRQTVAPGTGPRQGDATPLPHVPVGTKDHSPRRKPEVSKHYSPRHMCPLGRKTTAPGTGPRQGDATPLPHEPVRAADCSPGRQPGVVKPKTQAPERGDRPPFAQRSAPLLCSQELIASSRREPARKASAGAVTPS